MSTDNLPKITAEELHRRLHARSKTPVEERHHCPECGSTGGLSLRCDLRHVDGYTHRCTVCGYIINVKTGERTHPSLPDYDGAAPQVNRPDMAVGDGGDDE